MKEPRMLRGVTSGLRRSPGVERPPCRQGMLRPREAIRQ